MSPTDGSAPDQAATLLDTVESGTVLIVAETAGGISTGSGFVVGPGLIVTNLHVVDGALPDHVYVTNKRLGRAEPAKVLKSEGRLTRWAGTLPCCRSHTATCLR